MVRDIDLAELDRELAEFAEPRPVPGRSPVEERVLAGFEEIQRWVDKHDRLPGHGEGLDIFERLYAVRLGRIRADAEMRAWVELLDRQGLLGGNDPVLADPVTLSDDELAAELGDIADTASSEITVLRHVRSRAEILAAEEIASRQVCEDFENFHPLFTAVREELRQGVRQSRRFGKDALISEGDFFILGGQFVYVASMDESYRTPNGERNARLRVIYDNGTESDLLIRSLQRALYKDEAGRRITIPDNGPLFAGTVKEGEQETGSVYVLRSLSDQPEIALHRELIHKIGITGGPVPRRISNARTDPTYLLADVEIVSSYKLYNINRVRLEKLLHLLLEPARLDLHLTDRFGNPVSPQEWFLVPLSVIDEAIRRIEDGSIVGYRYDRRTASLVPA
ncbi:MAG: GIY-YIG nuclease family protein [Gemmatimonadota bacterium]|jgi:hypothetical protein|nr:GIY-YIG nuclease family protein [Gemmatimonadota bacterium]